MFTNAEDFWFLNLLYEVWFLDQSVRVKLHQTGSRDAGLIITRCDWLKKSNLKPVLRPEIPALNYSYQSILEYVSSLKFPKEVYRDFANNTQQYMCAWIDNRPPLRNGSKKAFKHFLFLHGGEEAPPITYYSMLIAAYRPK